MNILHNVIEFVFGSALFVNCLLFVPQAIKIFKEKTSLGVSFLTFSGFLIIQFAIVLHGIINSDYLLTVGYLLSMLTCGSVVILALVYKKSKNLSNININFEEILEQLPAHVYLKNKDGVMLYCNTKNWQDFGLPSLADFLGKTDYDIFPKNQADKIRQVDVEVMETGKAKIVEEECTKADKTVGLYLSYKIPFKDSNSEIVGIIGVSVDITDAKKKEIDRLEMLENIIAVMPGTVYWMNKEGVYLGCNDNEAKAIGLTSRKEIVGKRNVDIPGFLIPEALDPVNQEIMETGKEILLEEPAILADGTEGMFLSSKAPLKNTDGEIIGMVGISFDITEKKKTEQELLETQHKLEGMTLVSSAIAHEMRTPLSGFNIATDNVKVIFPRLKQAYLWAKERGAPIEEIKPFYLDYVEKQLNVMEKEVRAALVFIDIALMNTNLSFDAGNPKMLSISDIVDEALSRYPFASGQRELVKWQRNTDKDFLIKCDEVIITHVIFNLIKNALYYIAKAGKGDIQIWLETGTLYHKLYFKDTGTGIAADILPHIFERFFSATDKSAHPAGIGLTFCKKAMESLKGNIECESVKGDYTLFILSFPNNI